MTISNALLEGETHIQDISRQEGRGCENLKIFWGKIIYGWPD